VSWFNTFAFAATAAVQIAFTALLVWLLASNWLFDRKLILVSAGVATIVVASALPFNDGRLPVYLGIVLCMLVGAAITLAWLRQSHRKVERS
jgi:predicted branched-subunit amino acid permease